MKKRNVFYDINQFPKQEGMLVFGISMPKISNSQSARNCFNYVKELIPKIYFPNVGLTFLYGDNLYLYSDKNPAELKHKHQTLINYHKLEFKNILTKNPQFIPNSFSYLTWNQAILESSRFLDYFNQLKRIYKEDKQFQNYVKEDIKEAGKKFDDNSINFILEENLLAYLISKGQIRLQNDYVQDKQKWTLMCYPGKPLKSEIYLFQQNFFNLHNEKNLYDNCFYDLEENKLYEYNFLNLEAFKNE
jgi:hypothetical protein